MQIAIDDFLCYHHLRWFEFGGMPKYFHQGWLIRLKSLSPNLALFLALGKRRQELMLLGTNSGSHRRTLIEYTPKLVDGMIALVTAATVISYCLYTFDAGNLPRNHAMMLTIPFVLYGIFRYLYLLYARGIGGNPEDVLLKDRQLITTVSLWVLTAGLVLYLFGNPA